MSESDSESTTPPTQSRRAGRPRKLSDEALRALERLVQDHPGDSLEEIGSRLLAATGTSLRPATIRMRLKELGFVRVIPPRRMGGASAAAPADSEDTAWRPAAPLRVGYGPMHREKAPEALYHFGTSDAEWALVADIFEDKVRGTPRRYSRRAMLDAMTYVVRGGIPWRMLPLEFPPWHLVFKLFQRWGRQGRFERMYDRLREMWRNHEGHSAEVTAAVIDSQSVKTSPQGGPKGFDAAKKTKGRKRHLLTDTLGLLLAVVIQIADTQDRSGADDVVAAGIARMPSIKKIYADEGYAGQCKQRLEARYEGLSFEIARHPANRSVGIWTQAQIPLPIAELAPKVFVPLPKRWVIERTNAWNERPRRLAKDHDRTLASSTAWVWFSEARRLLRRLAWNAKVLAEWNTL